MGVYFMNDHLAQRMWLLFFTSLLLGCGRGNGISQKAVAEVTLTIQQTYSYCGGARPSEEIVKRMNEASPLPNHWCYIRPGKLNDVTIPLLDSARTDAHGIVRFKLPVGTYSVVFSDKKDASFSNTIKQQYSGEGSGYWSRANHTCLDEWLAQPELQISVKNSLKQKLGIVKTIPAHGPRCHARNTTAPCHISK